MIIIFVALITAGIVYGILSPALNNTPSVINSLAGENLGVVVIFGFSGILFFSLVGIPWLAQREVDLNPLTKEEENDPLTREVILNGSIDQAYDQCIECLHTHPSSRWYSLPDRSNNALIAWPLWGDYPKIKFNFSIAETDKTRIVISAATSFRGYSKKGAQKQRDLYPGKAYAHDTSRRLAIGSLNTIQQFFKNSNS